MFTLLLDLGRIDYQRAHSIMLELVGQRIEDSITDLLLLAEHDHVITVGKRGSLENVLRSVVPIVRVERGGDVTYHGPGMLMVYPIFKLDEKPYGITELVSKLEESVILSLHRLGINASRKAGYPGVWVKEKKVASIGLALKEWVTYHGMSINVSPEMSYFYSIRPCGMPGSVMCSITELVNREISVDEFKAIYLEDFKKVFSTELVDLDLRSRLAL
ncbi:MAG: lipoyl(octanoyl) transferase LipB [Aigarchaeota archaeon]|nr:lipoyl(octanoyl) transferase LipB [Aigarchaeota archaeon]MDW8092984.1 lipoyl(octanoyl) transferase LipB [Nitrososphaerota archaeon]